MKRILTLWAKRWHAHFSLMDKRREVEAREVRAMLEDLLQEFEIAERAERARKEQA